MSDFEWCMSRWTSPAQPTPHHCAEHKPGHRVHTCCCGESLHSDPHAPPKPAEPMGLGAVVEDTDGEPWVRVGGRLPWFDGRRIVRAIWGDLDAVRVLSEGVTDKEES